MTKPGPRKTILLVEDEPVTAKLGIQQLEKKGYAVMHASTGEEAVKVAREKRGIIDLILMDIDLGEGIDGTRAAEEILGEGDIPVVFLSSHTEPEVVEKTEKITSYGYVVKNSGIVVLDASIKMAFRLFDAKMLEKKNTSLLCESELRFRQIYEHVNIGIAKVGLDFIITSANPAYCEMLGYREDQLIGKHLKDITHTETVERNLELQKELALGKIDHFQLEKKFIHRDGSTVHGILNANLIRNEAGEPLYFLGSVLDISEKQRLFETLEREKNNYRSLFEDHTAIKLIFDPVTLGIVDANRAALAFYGYTRDELLSKTLQDLNTIPVNEIRERVDRTLAVSNISFELQHRLADGSLRNVAIYGNPIMIEGKKYIHVIIFDVTEHNRDLEEIARRERFWDTVLQTTRDGFWIVTPDKRLAMANQAYCEMSGYSREELEHLTINDLDAIEDPAETGKKMDMIIAAGHGLFETKHRRKDGSVFDVEVSIALLRSEGLLFCFCRDITSRKNAERLLGESRDKFQNLFETMEDGFLRADASGHIVLANKAVASMLGFASPGEMIGISMVSLYADEADRAAMIAEIRKTGTLSNYELALKTREGQSVVTLNNIRLLRNEAGDIAGTEGLIRDITEMKKIEQELRESESRFKALHDASFGGIAIHDKGRIFDCNQGLADMTGYSSDELIGMDGLLLIAEDSRDFVMEKIVSGYEKPYEATGRRKNGTLFPLRLEARNIPYRGRNMRSVEFRDLTEFKEKEAIIQKQLHEKEILMKEIHHRIKNNIGSVEALLSLQAGTVENEEALSIIRSAIARVQSMRLIYDKLLMTDEYREAPVKTYLTDLVSAVTGIFPRHEKITVMTSIDDFLLDVKILLPLGFIVNELLTNAMKYGFREDERGVLELHLTRQEAGGTLIISDNGRGLPESFDSRQSAGFGLTLVRMLTEQINGTFVMEGGQGTRCTVTFSLVH